MRISRAVTKKSPFTYTTELRALIKWEAVTKQSPFSYPMDYWITFYKV